MILSSSPSILTKAQRKVEHGENPGKPLSARILPANCHGSQCAGRNGRLQEWLGGAAARAQADERGGGLYGPPDWTISLRRLRQFHFTERLQESSGTSLPKRMVPEFQNHRRIGGTGGSIWVNPVIKVLQANGIEIASVHNHMQEK